MSKRTTTWGEVEKGDALELGGKVWVVQKAKRRGKFVKVVVARNGQTASSEVKAKASVERASVGRVAHEYPSEVQPKKTPLRDDDGRQQRWATKKEADKVGATLKAGDPSVTKPPVKVSDDPWETHRDRVERKLDDLLSAKLIAETPDESAGYYVPPQDITTIATHLVLMHARDHEQALDWRSLGVDDMLELHANQHEAALKGQPLAINHWHTKTRPPAA